MPLSTPESATAEIAAWVGMRAAGRPLLSRMLGSPTGRLGLTLCAPALLLGLLAPVIAPTDPVAVAGPSLHAPSWTHWMGTDALGRDVLSGVIFGARTSLILGLSVAAIASLIGIGVGATAGYTGGRLDDFLMRVTEFFQVIPRFFLAIVAIALFGQGLDRVILVLGLTSWPALARVIRADTLALCEQDFVSAARASGASGARVIVREILPNALPSALVMLGLLVGQVLLIEASLSFIGLGDPNLASWGAQAGQANPFLRAAWWLPLFPGLAIAITVLGCNLVADAATDALEAER